MPCWISNAVNKHNRNAQWLCLSHNMVMLIRSLWLCLSRAYGYVYQYSMALLMLVAIALLNLIGIGLLAFTLAVLIG